MGVYNFFPIALWRLKGVPLKINCWQQRLIIIIHLSATAAAASNIIIFINKSRLPASQPHNAH